jgi:hypothetical protein
VNGADVDRVVRGISFRAGLSIWKPKITVSHLSGGVTLRFEITVPHCHTGNLTDILLEEIYDDNELGKTTPEKFLGSIYLQIQKLVIHELDESFLFAGKPFINAHPERGSPRG